MRILLVNPPRFQRMPVIREERCEIVERSSVIEPYSLLQLGAILRLGGHEIKLLDLNGFNLDYESLKLETQTFKPQVVVFRLTPTTFDHDVRTAEVTKSVDDTILTIGVCWTLRTLPEEVLREAKHLDVYATREYEVTVPAIIGAVAEGRGMKDVKGIAFRDGDGIKVNPTPEPLEDLDSLPMPAYDLLPSLDPYFVTAPAGKPFTILYTSKGCPFKCTFCTVAGTKWRPRSAESLLEELRFLKRNYGIKTVSFFDETFTLDRKRVLAICAAMENEGLKIKWYCNTRTHLVDEELLRTMYHAGCRGISLGVESGSQKILDSSSKCTKVEQARNAILWSKKAGIKVFASFIIGLPGEDWSTVGETITFVKQTLPTSAEFNVAVPYPGTELFESVVGTKGKTVNFRLLYQHDAVIGTESLRPEDLNRARNMAYRSLYFNPSWWASNISHVIRHPEDAELASKYAMKVFKNYLFYRMEHAH